MKIFQKTFSKKSTVSFGELEKHFNQINNSTVTSIKNSQDYLNAYQTINFVGRCAYTIASDIGALDHCFKNKQTGEEVKSNRASDFIKNPLGTTNTSLWISYLVLHYLLDGNAFMARDINPSNLFEQIYPNMQANILNPALTDVYSKRNLLVTSTTGTNEVSVQRYYTEVYQGVRDNISPDDVVHLKMASPHNLIRGMGIVQMNATMLEQDQLTNIFYDQFFSNGAMTNLAVMPSVDMHPEEFDTWQKLFSEKFTGKHNIGKPIYLLPGGEIKELSMSLKDMETLEKQKYTKESIASYFFLPDLIAGLNGTGKYDTAPEQIKIYNTMTLPRFFIPVAKAITEYIQRFVDENIVFEFVPNKYIDKEKLSPVLMSAFDRGVITQNDYREMLGLQRLDDNELDERYMLLNYVPAEFNRENNGNTEDSSKSYESCGCDHVEKASKKQLQFHKTAGKVKDKVEKKINGFITEYFKGLEQRVLEGISKKAMNIEDMFDPRLEREKMLANARNFFRSAVTISSNDLEKMLQNELPERYAKDKINLAVEKLSINYVDLTIDTRRDELKKILSDTLEAGEGVGELSAKIEDHFKTLQGKNGWRANRIARTEAFHSFDSAAEINYMDLGIKTVDVVGCIDGEKTGYDCLKTNIPIEAMKGLLFPPNHTGTIVPSGI